jgi:hypothetical protein
MVCQAPCSAGMSRHGLPVRNRQTTPSNCCRNRSGYGPNLPIGRNGPINSHSSSVSSVRATLAFYQLGPVTRKPDLTP